ncbi:MAG: hypothetical protein K9H58_17290 [Bacteroidales bacterium]|nr:hypothetical protein [Bacteroidales bacterium]
MKNKRKEIINRTQLILILLALVGCMLTGNKLFSQNELKGDTKSIHPDSIIDNLTPLEYAFMMHEETSWLLKLNSTVNFGYGRGVGMIKIGAEKRISPSFTVDADFTYSSYGFTTVILGGSIEGRWYYRLNKRIRNNKLARSMSDNYFALGVSQAQTRVKYNENNESFDYTSVYAKWGLQRRFLKYGHADFGLRMNYVFGTTESNSPSFAISTFVDLGLSYTKDKLPLNHDKLCAILNCYKSHKFIIKSNLTGLFSLSLSDQINSISLTPHLAFEYKVGKTPFSINAEIQGGLSYTEYDRTMTSSYYAPGYDAGTGYIRNWQANMALEARYYYNLKRRMLNGKTGNSLSANYIGGGAAFIYNEPPYSYEQSFDPSYYVVAGWQRLIGKHLYFDVQLGLEYRDKTAYDYSRIEPRIKIALGYKF